MRGAPALQTRFKRNRHVCIEMVSIETCFPRAFRDEKEAKKQMWDSSPKHFVAKNCLKDYFWSQILLLSARRGRPRRERSQHLRKQIVRYGLFWMGADDCVSEKIQTRAGHIYRVTLILWLSWFARTSRLA